VGHNNDFGWAKSEVQTNQPLIVRLQAPRFFVVGDRVTLSAVINNNTDQSLQARAQLQAEGLDILGLIQNGRIVEDVTGSIEVEAGAQKRLNWIASVPAAGPVKISVVARADQYSDAMENTYRAHPHGIEKFLARSGKMRSRDLTIQLDLPSQRRPESTSVTVQLTPSLAVTMLDALPYLIDYPYGCTVTDHESFPACRHHGPDPGRAGTGARRHPGKKIRRNRPGTPRPDSSRGCQGSSGAG